MLAVHNAGTQTIDLSTLIDTREINDSGTCYVTGTGQYGIRVTGGKPNIYLEDAQISVSGGKAIDITGGNSTIHVKGNDNEELPAMAQASMWQRPPPSPSQAAARKMP